MRRAARAGALLAFVAAAQAGPAEAARIAADPALKPAFKTSIPDYTVRCRAGEPVRLSIDPPDRGPFVRSVALAPGRAAAVRFRFGERRRTYRVRCLPADFPDWRARRYAKPEAGWYLLTPAKTKGLGYAGTPDSHGYAAIFDSHGVPVWWMRRKPPPFAADLLPNGDVAWTNFVALSPASDSFVERTLTGRFVRSYSTVGTSTNQHDFELLPNGNALLITYPPREHVDLSRFGGPKDAVVLDGEIQEVSPDGGLVWSWSSKDHVALEESERWLRRQIAHPTIREYDGTPVYDLVHINSVEPSGPRLIFSARYLEAVYAIDRATRGIAWKLGGTHTPRSLAIHGDKLGAHEFGGQHDARISPRLDGLGGRLLTVFDNGTLRGRAPRALAFRLDLRGRVASLVRSVRFAPASKSVCCGSARLLAGQDWVISWGNTPWISEQGSHSQLVLTIELRGKDWASYRAAPILRDQMTRGRLAGAMRAMYGG